MEKRKYGFRETPTLTIKKPKKRVKTIGDKISYYIGYLTLPLTILLSIGVMVEAFFTKGNVTISNLLLTVWTMLWFVTLMVETPNWLEGATKSLGENKQTSDK